MWEPPGWPNKPTGTLSTCATVESVATRLSDLAQSCWLELAELRNPCVSPSGRAGCVTVTVTLRSVPAFQVDTRPSSQQSALLRFVSYCQRRS